MTPRLVLPGGGGQTCTVFRFRNKPHVVPHVYYISYCNDAARSLRENRKLVSYVGEKETNRSHKYVSVFFGPYEHLKMENFSRAKNYDLSETGPRTFKRFPDELLYTTITALSTLCTDISRTSSKSKTSRGTHFLITDCPSKHKYYIHAFAWHLCLCVMTTLYFSVKNVIVVFSRETRSIDGSSSTRLLFNTCTPFGQRRSIFFLTR